MVKFSKKPWWWYGITVIIIFLLSDFIFLVIGFFYISPTIDSIVAIIETFLRFLIWWIMRKVLEDLYIKKEFAVKAEQSQC